jgi:hypothetical protein
MSCNMEAVETEYHFLHALNILNLETNTFLKTCVAGQHYKNGMHSCLTVRLGRCTISVSVYQIHISE